MKKPTNTRDLKAIGENLKKMGWKPIFQISDDEITHKSEGELDEIIAADPANFVGKVVVCAKGNTTSAVRITQVDFDDNVYSVMSDVDGKSWIKISLNFSAYLENDDDYFLIACERA